MKKLALTILAILLFLSLWRKMLLRKNDKWGSGVFGASRGTRPHLGVDIAMPKNAPVFAPIDMEVYDTSMPYHNDSAYSGYKFTYYDGPNTFDGRMWYVNPDTAAIGKTIRKGEFLGYAQDLNLKYPGIDNHVHFQLRQTKGVTGVDTIEYKGESYANPLNFFNFF